MLSRPADSPTIGMVTALPKEFAAVELMLDEAEDALVDGDPGRYVVGRVGTHAMVLTLLPKMGIDPAAAVASHLLRSFPSVADILMVGIAGGVPHPSKPDKHVRLGDVVVSSGRGVVQFDVGRITQVVADGRAAGAVFENRDSAPPPSARLAQEVRILQARCLRSERPWEAFIERAASLGRSARPGGALDVLHDSESPAAVVEHPADADRRVGWPRIHDGVIASSNTLLKDPRLRDRLRDEHDVRAVEMEGAGIAAATWIAGRAGYLLVRGICDYCDTFKSDAWQEYAAVAAAAFARAVLVSLPQSHGLPEQASRSADIRRRLRKALVETFNLEELQNLCSDVQEDLAASSVHLPLSLDIVGGDSHEGRCLNLLTYLERRGYVPYLERAVLRARPLVVLGTASSAPARSAAEQKATAPSTANGQGPRGPQLVPSADVLASGVGLSRGRVAVGLIGSAGRDDLRPFCRRFGSELARGGFALVTGTSDIGKWTADSFHTEVSDSERILFVARERLSRPLPAFGTILHTGTDRDSYRRELVARADVAVVIRGGSGSQQEVERAKQRGVPILPVPATGGTARAVAEELRGRLGKLGIDDARFDGLADDGADPQTLADRVVGVLTSLSPRLHAGDKGPTASAAAQENPLENPRGRQHRSDPERFFADASLGDVLKPPMSGTACQNIRNALRMLGHDDLEYGDRYDEELARAVLRFQTDRGHSSRDGFVGPGTRRLLVKQLIARHGDSIFGRMTQPRGANPVEYDVALSFAGEDRQHAHALAAGLKARGIKVFYDAYEQATLWGKDLYAHLHEVYSRRARFCVIFVSEKYSQKLWTSHERRAAQERAFREKGGEYILPIRIDEISIPGLPETIGYIHIREGIDTICELLVEKIAKSK